MSLTSVSPVMATAYANGDGASPGYPPHQRNLHDQLEAFRRSDSARDTLLQVRITVLARTSSRLLYRTLWSLLTLLLCHSA